MILYNVTVNVEKDVEKEWLDWMKNTHVPYVMETNMFVENKMFRIMHDSEDGGINYSVQYFAKDMQDVMAYQHQYFDQHNAIVQKKFPKKLAIFMTLLELV
ncbi:DUF4286 family protein [Belliella aquatica]|uniref:DUF4286 domain-containing protein n=1 Tax=Belliella aquatica TaxID=1323734 RepID=A0ABQ1LJ34_9BACT|nr:DUF4286 family protein [Belliella aquatica]MCH7404126.1 DUF4286 family protein [Belliella aquatica]GGC25529.1 hypothetical protein GCM10010993_00750 [Belliella aquatica]